MTARILVVDDVPANVRLLEARLRAEYYEVRTALNGTDALEIARRERLDLVLLDVMMPDMTGFEVCRRLKQESATADVPVIMVTALDGIEDRVKGLESGADDFLTKPVGDVALLTRVRSLLRLKTVADELSLRATSVHGNHRDFMRLADLGGRILMVDDRETSSRKIQQALSSAFTLERANDAADALSRAIEHDYDLLVVSLSLEGADGLRLCSQFRTIDRARYTPVLLITDPDENARLLRALDLGVNDYIVRPVDANEMRARVRTQLRRKKFSDRLTDMVSSAMELSITDPLTGLYNRRHLDTQLRSMVAIAEETGKPLSLLIFDIDFFKGINDRYGHDAGDDVLREFATRMRKGVRGIDLVARFGGEEFVVAMPETDAHVAAFIADRLRRDIDRAPFATRTGDQIPVTVSIGVAEHLGQGDTIETLVRRADQALYSAKRGGRNRVVEAAA
ncbi:response regulator receiver modulated diguanylate cyclase [Faunimonas pinastri]|uniref:diguanylate cyclase n=1 Tax=Faunimonas pinastri TaxID=1855383 RepID=A0A1H9CGD8_9HYPH|nr:PleD family two-component system response regulator [Faunimonas pinastri]SEQ00232.1 response regulator receiver modulated diguanylate cyclase [Faunimonas pinastri]